jgi:hypothetical protein
VTNDKGEALIGIIVLLNADKLREQQQRINQMKRERVGVFVRVRERE